MAEQTSTTPPAGASAEAELDDLLVALISAQRDIMDAMLRGGPDWYDAYAESLCDRRDDVRQRIRNLFDAQARALAAAREAIAAAITDEDGLDAGVGARVLALIDTARRADAPLPAQNPCAEGHLFAERSSRYDLRCVHCGISSLDPAARRAGADDGRAP